MDPISERLRRARTERGWSQLRLVRELRKAAAKRGHQIPTDDSIKRRIASWENGHSVPEGFTAPCSGTHTAPAHMSWGWNTTAESVPRFWTPATPTALTRRSTRLTGYGAPA